MDNFTYQYQVQWRRPDEDWQFHSTNKFGEHLWYPTIFGAKRLRSYLQTRHWSRNNDLKYRILRREVSDWEIVDV